MDENVQRRSGRNLFVIEPAIGPHENKGNVTDGPDIARACVAASRLHSFLGEGETVMKLNLLKKRVIGVALGLSLLVGIGVSSSSSVAQAQWQDPNWQREQARRQREWEREQRRRQRQNERYNDRYNDRYDDRYGYGGSFQLRQTALNAGYNEGIKEGRKDRSRNERFEYRDEEDYRNANTDYSSRLGDRNLYAQYFRQGFVNGYSDGYRGY